MKKFHFDRLRNDRTLGNRKSDKKQPHEQQQKEEEQRC